MSRVLCRGQHVLASGHGQETNQFTEDDVEFYDLGRRGIYAAAVHAAGAFCVEDFLVRDREPDRKRRAAPAGQPGAAVPT